MVGLAMFSTLFLGVVLAVFLTLGAVRGDAERGLLQPLVVRPVSRPTLLLARWLGAIAVCTPYVIAVYAAAMVITGLTGDWWPDHIVVPAIELAGGVAIVAAMSLLGSVFLTATANGIAIFMLFGAGLVSGLLGSIGHALNSARLEHWATIVAWAAPFEALYQDGLREITAKTIGLTGYLIQLGPFGGANTGGTGGPALGVRLPLVVGLVASVGFSRRDLWSPGASSLAPRESDALLLRPPSGGGRPVWPPAGEAPAAVTGSSPAARAGAGPRRSPPGPRSRAPARGRSR